jgi:HEPN domain-containing protein
MLRAFQTPYIPPELIVQAQSLDAHYIPARYPNGFPEGKPADYFNAAKAQEAIDAAHSIIRFCQDHLPESG